MISWDHVAYEPLFFHFGIRPENPSEGLPLVCLNGGIMVDNGHKSFRSCTSLIEKYFSLLLNEP